MREILSAEKEAVEVFALPSNRKKKAKVILFQSILASPFSKGD